ncbi:hypothetical protein GF314_15035 [bacterium]|nr:hypothetical protein [bacterium]
MGFVGAERAVSNLRGPGDVSPSTDHVTPTSSRRRPMRPILTVTALGLALFAIAAAPASAGWFDRGVKGNGEMTTTSYDLDECHAVRLECGLDIAIRFGDTQRVELTMDENLVEHYEIEERDGVLVVSTDENTRPDRDARLELVMRELDRVEVVGAGDIEIDGLDGESFAIAIAGAGDIKVDGEVASLDIEINGAGDIDARDLEARRATVQVNGAGDVKVNAREACSVEINGVGDVDVYGDPESFEKSVHGIGDVDRK